MKKIFTLALTVISYTAFAHPNDGKLSVTNLSNQIITIEIDGKASGSRNAERYFMIPELTPGLHTVKLYTIDNGKTASKSLMLQKKVYILQRSFNVKSKYHIDIIVNRFGRATVDEMFMNDVTYKEWDNIGWYSGNDNYNNDPRNGGGYNNNGSNNGGYGNNNNGNTGNNNGGPGNNGNAGNNNGGPGNNGGYNNGNNGNNNGGYGNNNGTNNGNNGNGSSYNPNDPRYNDPRYNDPRFRPMSDQSFAAFKDVLIKERFDNARVTIAKQVIDQNYFTADQVKQIAQVFSFDNYKLDIAKTAYKNTVNRGEYFVIYEVFSFSNSKEDLANFIKSYK